MTTQELTKRDQADVVRRDQQHQQTWFRPATDICETENELVLTFDMPGVGPDQVDLTVEKDTLTVTGKADPEAKGTAVYRETRIGDYQRQFSLNEQVDADRITADMKNGVLTVRIPKAEKAKPKRINVKVG